MNNYPVVLIHGMFGYGQQQSTNEVLPYFGLYKNDIRALYEKLGTKCVAPSCGPFTGAWDRACEVYAQLVGGTVDYGKAHSAYYGHERFGKTYDKPLLAEWGQLDEEGKRIKINIIGHSFGGITGRTLAMLMAFGSKAEKLSTDPADLSPLFKGGHEDWVNSITTLASPHNGMTSVEGKVGKVMKQICVLICDVFSVVEATPLKYLYNLSLEHWGITPGIPKDRKIRKYFNGKDCINYDLTLKGADAANGLAPTLKNVYYFSYRGGRTVSAFGMEIPRLKSFPVLNVLGFFMGRQKDGCPDDSWHKNDMVINTISAEAPQDAPRVDVPYFVDPETLKPGVWHVFPERLADHMSFLGWTQDKGDFIDFYKKILKDAQSVG